MVPSRSIRASPFTTSASPAAREPPREVRVLSPHPFPQCDPMGGGRTRNRHPVERCRIVVMMSRFSMTWKCARRSPVHCIRSAGIRGTDLGFTHISIFWTGNHADNIIAATILLTLKSLTKLINHMKKKAVFYHPYNKQLQKTVPFLLNNNEI